MQNFLIHSQYNRYPNRGTHAVFITEFEVASIATYRRIFRVTAYFQYDENNTMVFDRGTNDRDQ